MSEKTARSVLCDHCGSELVVDSCYPSNYCLELRVADYGFNSSGMVHDIMQFPPIDATKHFCGVACLARWSASELLKYGNKYGQKMWVCCGCGHAYHEKVSSCDCDGPHEFSEASLVVF